MYYFISMQPSYFHYENVCNTFLKAHKGKLSYSASQIFLKNYLSFIIKIYISIRYF